MNRERPLEHRYTLHCEASRTPAGVWCDAQLQWTGDLPADAGAREAQVEALRAAVAAGWRVEQDHDGHVRVFCPGREPLPADILRGDPPPSGRERLREVNNEMLRDAARTRQPVTIYGVRFVPDDRGRK